MGNTKEAAHCDTPKERSERFNGCFMNLTAGSLR